MGADADEGIDSETLALWVVSIGVGDKRRKAATIMHD